MNFIDRRSASPGRYKMTLDNGEAYYITLERADGPIVPGTPLNAATFNAMQKELRSCVEARNLLDNSNFANPVNQRGYDAYGYAEEYNIDRWKAASKLWVTVMREYGYILLECSDDAADRYGFTQCFAEEKTPAAGAAITVAYEDFYGNVVVGTAEMPETGSVAIGDTTGVGFRVYSAAEGAKVALMLPAGERISLRWMAVYEGEFTKDNLPAYRPKDYSAELMECMRYYQIHSTSDVAAVDLCPAMRATPTVTKVEGGYAYCADL